VTGVIDLNEVDKVHSLEVKVGQADVAGLGTRGEECDQAENDNSGDYRVVCGSEHVELARYEVVQGVSTQ